MNKRKNKIEFIWINGPAKLIWKNWFGKTKVKNWFDKKEKYKIDKHDLRNIIWENII